LLATQIKRLLRQSAIYGVGGVISRLIAIFLLPLYTTYLGTSGFGKIETIVALSAVLEGRRATDARGANLVLVHDGDGDARARRRLCLRDADRPRPAVR
jgi:hypothetical protein